MITILNDTLKANINFKGAELNSLIKIDDQTEYIWQADPNHWARHAPFLFPIVGKLKNDEYLYDGNQYNLSQHGFVRDLDFDVISNSTSECTLELKSSMNTRISYPFKFSFRVSYALLENFLETSVEIENTDHHDMYFSFGGHPAFKCPIDNESKRSDYYLKFEKNETVKSQIIENGIRNGVIKDIFSGSDRIDITDDLFKEDALIFEGLDSSFVSLMKNEKKILTFDFKGFPYLGIWSTSSTSPFICIEPWFGIADHKNHNFELSQKEGVLLLAPKAKFFTKYSIEIH